MIVLFLISFNSLILLYHFPLFKMLTKVWEGQERPTVPNPLSTTSHFAQIIYFIMNNLSELKQVKKQPQESPQTPQNNPLKLPCPLNERLWSGWERMRGFSFFKAAGRAVSNFVNSMPTPSLLLMGLLKSPRESQRVT